MMISAQISIQIIPAKGPPLVIALKDVHNFASRGTFLCVQKMCKCPPPPSTPTHHHTHPFLHLCTFYRQNPQKHLLSRSKCQLIISPKHVFN